MSCNFHHFKHKQRGAALMVMIVIMVVGTLAVLVNSLNSSSLKIQRDQISANALAKAKEALIGRAAADVTVPGSLPCPDTNDDGTAQFLSGNDCPSYIGRLPWKTLGLPELRDGAGEHLWYALSRTFRDDNSAHPLNSESMGTLNLNGIQTASNLIAIVFAPGAPINAKLGGVSVTQSRSANSVNCATTGNSQPENLCATNYLEGTNGNLSSSAVPNINYQSGGSTIFNDQLITISREQLFPTVEMRIAREVKSCLDNYALANGNKYPWAAATTDTTLYYSKNNTLFGRLPKHQTPDANVQSMVDAISALQNIVTGCASNPNNQSALVTAGATLDNAATATKNNQPSTPAIPSSVTTPAMTAGDRAKDATVTCANIQADPVGNSIQTNLNAAVAGLNALPASIWPASCTVFNSAYWPDWRNQVFYQVDTQYNPNGGLGAPNLSINGTGSYRAVVMVARSPLNGLARNPSDFTTYLEGGNRHTNPTNPSSAFVSNSVSDANYSVINDLVLCLDGKVNCK